MTAEPEKAKIVASPTIGGAGALSFSTMRGTKDWSTASYVRTVPGAALQVSMDCAVPSDSRRKRSWDADAGFAVGGRRTAQGAGGRGPQWICLGPSDIRRRAAVIGRRDGRTACRSASGRRKGGARKKRGKQTGRYNAEREPSP